MDSTTTCSKIRIANLKRRIQKANQIDEFEVKSGTQIQDSTRAMVIDTSVFYYLANTSVWRHVGTYDVAEPYTAPKTSGPRIKAGGS